MQFKQQAGIASLLLVVHVTGTALASPVSRALDLQPIVVNELPSCVAYVSSMSLANLQCDPSKMRATASYEVKCSDASTIWMATVYVGGSVLQGEQGWSAILSDAVTVVDGIVKANEVLELDVTRILKEAAGESAVDASWIVVIQDAEGDLQGDCLELSGEVRVTGVE